MSQSYSLCEVAENNGQNGRPIWLIVKGVVYDMTKFVQEHPGGEESIMEYAGKDATKAFNEVGHSTDAIREMKMYKVGVVAPPTTECVIMSSQSKVKIQTNSELAKHCESEQQCRKTHKRRIKLFFCF